MDAERLKARGWKAHEIAHAKGIFDRAEGARTRASRVWDHAMALLLGAVIAVGGIALLLWLFPILYVVHPAVRLSITFLVGAGEGLLVLGAWKDARHHPHHMTGALVLLCICTIIVGIALLGTRAGIESALSLTAGVAIPYLVWRSHGPR